MLCLGGSYVSRGSPARGRRWPSAGRRSRRPAQCPLGIMLQPPEEVTMTHHNSVTVHVALRIAESRDPAVPALFKRRRPSHVPACRRSAASVLPGSRAATGAGAAAASIAPLSVTVHVAMRIARPRPSCTAERSERPAAERGNNVCFALASPCGRHKSTASADECMVISIGTPRNESRPSFSFSAYESDKQAAKEMTARICAILEFGGHDRGGTMGST